MSLTGAARKGPLPCARMHCRDAAALSATGQKPDAEPPSGQAGDVPTRPRCRTKNRTDLSTLNLGTWLCLPGQACHTLSFEAQASNNARPDWRGTEPAGRRGRPASAARSIRPDAPTSARPQCATRKGLRLPPLPSGCNGQVRASGRRVGPPVPIMAEPWPVTLTQRRGASARPASYCRGRLIQPLCRRSGQAQANPRRQSGPGMNAGERRWTTPSRPPTDLERRSAEAGCRLASSRHKSSRPTADEHTEQRSSSPAGRQLRLMRFIANVMVSPPSWQPK
jgi:hypothetical protein